MEPLFNAVFLSGTGETMERLFDLDFQLLHDAFWSALAVFILFLVMSYLLFNPIRELLEKRQARIKDDLDSAAKDKEAAASLKSEYEERLGGIEKQSEEILSEYEYPRTIKCNDRATMLNMMQGMHGYTLCSGIISDDINGDGYIAIPFKADKDHPNSAMQIGYLTKKNNILSEPGQRYIDELKAFLQEMEGLSN